MKADIGFLALNRESEQNNNKIGESSSYGVSINVLECLVVLPLMPKREIVEKSVFIDVK